MTMLCEICPPNRVLLGTLAWHYSADVEELRRHWMNQPKVKKVKRWVDNNQFPVTFKVVHTDRDEYPEDHMAIFHFYLEFENPDDLIYFKLGFAK